MVLHSYKSGSSVTILEKKYVIPINLEFIEKQYDNGEIIITVTNIVSGKTKAHKITAV